MITIDMNIKDPNFYISIIIICIFVLHFIIGCNEFKLNNNKEKENTDTAVVINGIDFFTHTIKNHDYVIANSNHGISITHSESCPCKNKYN